MNLGGKPISPKTPFPRNQIRAQNSIPLNKTAYSRIVVYRIQKNYEFRRETHFPKSPISKKKIKIEPRIPFPWIKLLILELLFIEFSRNVNLGGKPTSPKTLFPKNKNRARTQIRWTKLLIQQLGL